MRAAEIRALAVRAGIAPGVSVLDLCCGVAGPGRFITHELGCTYLGVDASSSAIEIARERAGDLPCRFEVARIPPLPAGPFDVVLLLETMLAFPREGAAAGGCMRGARARRAVRLHDGGGHASDGGRAGADAGRGTVADAAGGDAHRLGASRAGRPLQGGVQAGPPCDGGRADRRLRGHAEAIAAQIGSRVLWKLLASHRLWSDWLRDGRVESSRSSRRSHERGTVLKIGAPRVDEEETDFFVRAGRTTAFAWRSSVARPGEQTSTPHRDRYPARVRIAGRDQRPRAARHRRGDGGAPRSRSGRMITSSADERARHGVDLLVRVGPILPPLTARQPRAPVCRGRRRP